VRQLDEAVVVWTGTGTKSWPARHESLLVERFGSELASELMPKVRALSDDFYRSEARLVAHDLTEMADAASQEFRRIHPEVSDEAVQALAWCYTFEYK
jgi:hypothetical protein